ncbi:MAG TPA: hypothetical protein VNZ86_06295 [Bacteroidia bacterium]|jgi:hypothetical protein|nr:hypothetical protein [Bacteroidia bacterium]
MKAILETVIVIWVLWKIFGGQTIIHKYHFTQQHNHTYQGPQEGEVKVEKPGAEKPKKLKDDAGEYIDYEEIK